MRWLIDYIRSCFCKHEWELLKKTTVYGNEDYWGRTVEPYVLGTRWFYRCNKCGHSKTYQNF